MHRAKLIEEFGIENDAHAGKWHRQVSLLSYEKIEEFKAKGAPIDDGAFGENLIVSGYDLKVFRLEQDFAVERCCWKLLRSENNVTVAVKFSKLWEIVLCQEKVFLQECFMEESLKRGMRFI